MKNQTIINELGSEFYEVVTPADFPSAQLRWFNTRAAKQLGLPELTSEEIKNYFWKFDSYPGNLKNPLALAYHGHQFRHYNPDIGDGRGFLYAQFKAEEKIYDLSTKGSGTTPFSRSGDGRLTLKGAVREVLASEYLSALGVNSSQTLCVFETGESLERGDEPSPTRSAVMTRMVHGSIRFGTFQRLAYLNEKENLKKLVEFCLRNYYPQEKHEDKPPAQILFQLIIEKSAALVSQFMTTGFIHAVLNTDNMNITGEVFDFGPYRFLPKYNPSVTAAYFDYNDLYSFGRQPESYLWGLEQLGLALQKIDPTLSVETLLEDFATHFNHHHKKYFFQRLNLRPLDDETDQTLIAQFYQMLSEDQKDFEKTFFDFYGGHPRSHWKKSVKKKDEPKERMTSASVQKIEKYADSASFDFIETLKKYSPRDSTKLSHPYFLGTEPETLLIQDIEHIWQPIALRDDWSVFDQKLQRLGNLRAVYV